jgi:hypothetical protein
MSRNLSGILKWAFVGKEVAPTSLNIICSAISKFLTVFIHEFSFAQSNFVKNIKKGLIKDKPKNPRYSNIWNPDILLDYYLNINIEKRKFPIFTDKNCSIIRIFPHTKTN